MKNEFIYLYEENSASGDILFAARDMETLIKEIKNVIKDDIKIGKYKSVSSKYTHDVYGWIKKVKLI